MEHPDSLPKCQCGLTVVTYTSRQRGSEGRQFYRCPKPIGEANRCKYFEWIEPSQPSSSSQGLPPTPKSEPPTSQGRTLQPPSTPTPMSSAKRSFSTLDEFADPQPSPASQKRAKTMESALTAQHDEFDAILDEREHIEHPVASWPPQTPKRTSQRPANAGGLLPTPSPMVYGKFQPSVPGPSGGSSGRQPITPGNMPFSSQETLDGEDQEELSADLIAKLVQPLGDIPAYIRKLERKKVAAEKSRDIKAAKIVDLEKEVERLKAREKELENLVEMLEKDAQYLGCAKRSSDRQCTFEVWLEGNATEHELPPTPQASGSMPASSQSYLQPPSTPTPSSKRVSSVIDEQELELTPSQKRLKIIQAALRGPPCPEPTNRATTPVLISSPVLPDDVATLGLATSVQAPETSSQASRAQSRSPAPGGSAGFHGPVAGDLVDIFGIESLPHTPRTGPQETLFRPPPSPSPSPYTSLKGKQRAYDNVGTSGPSGSVSTPLYSGSSNGVIGGLSAGSIADMLVTMNGIPDYIRGLQVRAANAERENELKTLRLRHLENEVERLKAKQEELEEIIGFYQSSQVHHPFTHTQ
ncbi:unnamed protein product [Cyclocybe aegerita]|uniref:GRF-type domain-containing protein n=1 Tax=Cyclocybe aegerita TaxID=1973307 RepID=A0A8S0WGQ5_CYCAE|nr:unnamed protein product [Cyclocybe aegerita]